MHERSKMLDSSYPLSIRKQAKLLNISRSNYYYKTVLDNDSELSNMLRDVYLSSDCRYGYRKITASLNQEGILVNDKKVLRLTREMNIQGLYPKKNINTSIKNKEHKNYPYLLKDLEIIQPNQV